MPDGAMTRGSGARGPGHGVRERWDAGPPQTEASPPCPEPKTRRKTTGKARHLPTSKAKVNRANVVRLLPVLLLPLPRPRAWRLLWLVEDEYCRSARARAALCAVVRLLTYLNILTLQATGSR